MHMAYCENMNVSAPSENFLPIGPAYSIISSPVAVPPPCTVLNFPIRSEKVLSGSLLDTLQNQQAAHSSPRILATSNRSTRVELYLDCGSRIPIDHGAKTRT